MSERLKAIKPCPLCGGDAGHNGDFNFGPDYAYCENSVCQLDGYSIPIDEWQSRPEEDSLTARNAALVEELARVNGLLVHVYNSGYHGGHHDTVEAVYTDIHQGDMDDIHSEEVAELVADLLSRRTTDEGGG